MKTLNNIIQYAIFGNNENTNNLTNIIKITLNSPGKGSYIGGAVAEVMIMF